MFMTKKQRSLRAYATLCEYIDEAADRFNRAFLFEHQRTLLTMYSRAIMIHYASIIFNVEDTVMEVYYQNSKESEQYRKDLVYDYFEIKHAFKKKESTEYYNSLGILNSMTRYIENPMNQIYDIKYGQLIYALECFLREMKFRWSSPLKNQPPNIAIYFFFVNEEPTMQAVVDTVMKAIS